MGKFEPLTRHLQSIAGDVWDARFDDVAKVLGAPLPTSAHKYNAWWANQEPAKSQTAGWRDAGWETCKVDLAAKRVRFVRSGRARPLQSDPAIEALFTKAAELTGENDRKRLTELALNALIQREAAVYLGALGGTMPDAKAPPRRRFPWQS